jgi:hypothetical protein
MHANDYTQLDGKKEKKNGKNGACIGGDEGRKTATNTSLQKQNKQKSIKLLTTVLLKALFI